MNRPLTHRPDWRLRERASTAAADRWPWLLALLALVAGLSSVPAPTLAQRPNRGEPPAERDKLEVTGYVRVIDGDTIDTYVDGKRTGIGLIGVEAPMGNTPCGKDAKDALRDLVKGGITLEEDPDEAFDARGRRMLHVKAGDGRPAAEELARDGVVKAAGKGKDRQKVAAALAEARQRGRGCVVRLGLDGSEPGPTLAEQEPEPAFASLRPGAETQALLAGAPAMTAAAAPAAATGLPSGFVQDTVAGGLVEPTAFTFLPDGRILVALKSGVVRVVEDGALLPTPFVDLQDRVNDYWDHGLLGIAADPEFAQNGRVYLTYTSENNPADYTGTKTARVSRITASPPSADTASPSSEVVILGTQSAAACGQLPAGADCIPSDYSSHSIGNVKVAPDGTLFVTTGDAASFNNVDDLALRAQDLDSLAGKVLHVNPDGSGVAGNPFWNGSPSANRSKVWAYGLRNAFRFNLKPNSALPYYGDVGWNTLEEVGVAKKGANLGWPCYEGDIQQFGYGPKPGCQALYAQGAAAVQMPLVAWPHNDGGTCCGAAATGGTFYTGTAYPAEYQGAYFYADYAKEWIRYLRVDPNDGLVPGSVATFATATDAPTDLELGPDGNLYYMAIKTGQLRRVRYSFGNTPPVGVASATPANGLAPLAVQFSSAGSSDSDGDALQYSWDFGDGSPPSTEANPSHTYAANGTHTARLTLSDGRGGTGTANVAITVGNRAPTATITAPAPSYRFKVGDVIEYAGSGSDPDGGAIPDSGLTWSVTLYHCPGGQCHIHPLTSGSGAGGSFTIPDHGDETHFEITLTTTDGGGLSGSSSVTIQPQTARITLDTAPSGLEVVLDGTAATGPFTRTVLAGSTHTLTASGPQWGGRYAFASWSDNGAAQHDVVVHADATYTATFEAPPPAPGACPCSLWSDSATPAVASEADTQPVELGVRFRPDVDGYVTGLRFYKGPGNTGTHVGSLWTASGTRLASATFGAETATGWQQVSFPTPVAVIANTTYLASYHAPNGGFALTRNGFTSRVDRGPLHALASATTAGNGVFTFGPSALPTESYQDSNYWVDVVFATSVAPDITSPTISEVQATNLTGSGATITWATDEAADSRVEYGTSAGYGSSSPLDVAKVTAHSVQLSGLQPSTTYHHRVRSTDAAGNEAISVDATFTTTAPPPPASCPCSLWSGSAAPATPSLDESEAVELGVKFKPSIDGYVTGVRFYKGPGNTGAHVGSLWSESGQRLANATFVGETAGGWQQVSFGTPVQVTANTTYVASYHAPNGHYSRDQGFFATTVTSGPLTAPDSGSAGGNGVFKFGPAGSFPDGSFQATNYWVDVVYTTTPPAPDTAAPTISAAQATNVTGTGATISWTTDEPADSQVEYGPTTAYGSSTTLDSTPATGHSVTLSGLQPGTLYHYRVRSKDGAGNGPTVSADATFTTTAAPPASCPCSLWDDSAPGGIAFGDSQPFELGVKFRANTSGYISGLRFYKGAANSGTHVGSLWSAGGQRLAQATFTEETASGWQQVSFASPVAITANTTYVASYYAPNGGYARSVGFFTTSGVTSGPLTALRSGTDGPNGVYQGAPSGFPSASFQDTNYWVDVVFTTTPPASDGTPPTLSAVQATSVTSSGATITWTTNEPADSQVEYGTSASYGSSTALNPGLVTGHSVVMSGLQPGTTYHYRVKSKDAAGNGPTVSADSTFTTAAPPPPSCPCSLWSAGATPGTPASDDGQAVEVGVKFKPSTNGYVTGIRFYKGAGNTGTHVGSLWSAGGTRLANATFAGETATGWQQVSFASPVQVTADATYVASYHAPNGHYARDQGFFAGGLTSGPLQAPASAAAGGNGVYRYGSAGSFPDGTYQATNYWVDVVFATTPPAPDTIDPTISGVQATNVTASAATITWTTDEPADSWVEYGTTTGYGSSSPLDGEKVTAHSVGLSGLQAGTTYHYRVKSKDAAGNEAASGDRTFTTAAASPGGGQHGSLSLGGSGAYATAAHAAELNTTGDWTVEAWFKDESSGGYNHEPTYLLFKGDMDSHGEAPYLVAIDWNDLVVGSRTGWTNYVLRYQLGANGVSANAWHHAAATLQASTQTLTIYLNGRKVMEGTLSKVSPGGNTLAVNVGWGGAGRSWRGKVDDVRIWNVVRTGAQIQASYDGQLGSAPAGLVANWKLDDGSGTKAADSTQPDQDATLKGGATWSTDVHP